MDSHFHYLHMTGVGQETKHARVLTRDDEDKLWKSSVMGTRTSRALQKGSVLCGGENVQPSWGCWNETSQDFTNKKTRQPRQINMRTWSLFQITVVEHTKRNIQKVAHFKQSCPSVCISSSVCNTHPNRSYNFHQAEVEEPSADFWNCYHACMLCYYAALFITRGM